MAPHGSKNVSYTPSLTYTMGKIEPSFYFGSNPELLSDCTSFSSSKLSSGVGYTTPFALNFFSLAKSYSSFKLLLRTQLSGTPFLHFSLYFSLQHRVHPPRKHLSCSIIVIAVSLTVSPTGTWASWELSPCLFGSVLHLAPSTRPVMRVIYTLKANPDANWNWGSGGYC